MADFSVRSDNVDVEQIMGQIRARIREKRGVDYTEEEIRELANVRLEKFLDPRGVRSDLIEQFRRKREAALPPSFAFEDSTIYDTHRGLLRFIRKILNPILKLFFNPQPIADALHIQSKLNAQQAALEPMYYEVIHNLVVESTRLGIEVKNLKMRLESMSSRLDFDERRARALEGVVQYRPGAVAPLQPPTGGGAERPLTEAEQAERRSRRRRRRGRRRPGEAREGSSPAFGAPGQEHDMPGEIAAAESRPTEGAPSATREEAPRRYDAEPAPPTTTHGGGGSGEPVPPPASPKPGAGFGPGEGGKPGAGFGPGEGGKPGPGFEPGEGGPVPPKPPDFRGGEGGPVPPKPPDNFRGGEGG
jgi:hypothetical protein